GEVHTSDAGRFQQPPRRGWESLDVALDRAAEGFGNRTFDLGGGRPQRPASTLAGDQLTGDQMVDGIDHEQRIAGCVTPKDRCQRTMQLATREALHQVRAETGLVERRERNLGSLTA